MRSRPSKELKEALENLSTLTAAGEAPTLATLAQLDVREGRIVPLPLGALKKAWQIAFAFLSAKFPTLPVVCKDDLYQTVVESSEIVSKNASLLYFWEGGAAEQRRFATYAKTVIARFNKFVEDTKQAASDTTYFFKFFHTQQFKLGKTLTKIEVTPTSSLNIHIPTLSSTQFDPLKMLSKIASKAPGMLTKKVAQLRESFLPVQAKELFLMKAISLLERKGIASHAEARVMVRRGIIRTTCEEGIHTLSLTLHPYPDRTIEIEGAFMGRIPLPDSFHISLSSTPK